MSTLRRYNYSESAAVDEVLRVLEAGVDELKEDINVFSELSNPYLVPTQFVPLLTQTLGLDVGTGLTNLDRRALLIALGWAYHFKGAKHGLRLIARTLWRYGQVVEVYRDILDHAVAEGVENISGWPAFLTAEGYTTDELLRVLLNVRLDIYDARRYGDLQAREFRQLLDIVRQDSGYERLLRTYRPGFDAAMSTLLGTSQFTEGVEGQILEDEAFFLYGHNFAFLDPATQSILESLRWNPYPAAKIGPAKAVVQEFIPLVTNLELNFLGYRTEDTVTVGADEELTIA